MTDKPAIHGIDWAADGDANFYTLFRNGHWLAKIQFNGKLLVPEQEALLTAMLAAAPAVQVEPVLDAPFGGILYLQVDGKPDQWRRINPCKLYTSPQPAEQLPAPDVDGLEQQHHRDSAELRRLCQARDEQRDGRLAALERAAKAEADVAQLVEALEAARAMWGDYLPPGNSKAMVAMKSVDAALAAHRKGGDA